MMFGADVIIGVAGLAIGIPGLLDVIFRVSKLLLQRLQSYGDDYKNLIRLVVRISKSQTQDLVSFIDRANNEIPDDLNADLLDLFQALRSIYEELLGLLPGTDSAVAELKNRASRISRGRKQKVDDAIRRLEDWNDRFFKRIVLFLLFDQRRNHGITTIDDLSIEEGRDIAAVRRFQQLRNAVDNSLSNTRAKQQYKLLLDRSETSEELTRLKHSCLWIRKSQNYELDSPSSAVSSTLIEYRTYSDDARERDVAYHRRVVREIACIFHEADPQLMGVLHCQGFLFDSLENRFELRFDYPESCHNPRSLLDVLSDPVNRERGVIHPLQQRIEVAKSVVSALFLLHAADFVHKQIRPDNIILFDQIRKKSPDTDEIDDASVAGTPTGRDSYPYCLGRPFLAGFENCRKADAHSLMVGTEEWRKTIYLSPERCRLKPGDEFTMEHDMYSLGIVLLEIGIWASFCNRQSAQLGKRVWQDQKKLKGPEELKKMYLNLAAGILPRIVGQKYADVVATCLSGFKEERQKGDFEDRDGIVLGTAYITKVIRKLEEISM
ncbi:MAG: hypothetical protein M1814_002472 [Vezdaea aestivalis]|nr:MAG: hypothetical protein M1814_002472 [Vezdaea aestivalis]